MMPTLLSSAKVEGLDRTLKVVTITPLRVSNVRGNSALPLEESNVDPEAVQLSQAAAGAGAGVEAPVAL